MTGVLFQEFLKRFDCHVRRRVILVIDNARSHICENLQLSNVKVISLPPNTTSKLQPLDAGIITAFKMHYRLRQIAWGLDKLDLGGNPYKSYSTASNAMGSKRVEFTSSISLCQIVGGIQGSNTRISQTNWPLHLLK